MGDVVTTQSLLNALQVTRERLSLTETELSRRIVGYNSLFSELRKADTLPRGETIRKIAEFCGLQFYVGPPKYDGTHRHDGSLDHSGAPIGAAVLDPDAPPPLSPRIVAALRLPADATEADALARIAGWPDTAHQIMARRHALDARARALADRLEAALAPLLADLRAGLDAPMLGDDPKE